MPIHNLTTLQHSEDRKGPFQLYILNAQGYHSGGKWFRPGPVKYPDEEIPLARAKAMTDFAIKHGQEVRICDGGDMLVYHHDRNGKVLHGENFWKDLRQ